MDVVYNPQDLFIILILTKPFPGIITATRQWHVQRCKGCGTEIASERSMVRKFIVDSILFWAMNTISTGFVSLNGVFDIETMNTIRHELDKIDPAW
jgi:pullulanase